MKLRNRNGFTITEMIVVIAIIGVLVAILIPALFGVRGRSKKIKELNVISHVGKAWMMYSSDHQDKLLEGYLSTQVQEYKDMAWAFKDTTLVPPAPTYEEGEPNDAGPWTWRLLDYLDYDWRSILFYRDTDEWTSEEARENADVIAAQPAFGYNGFYLGGWWEIDSHSGKPAEIFGSVLLTDGRRVNVVEKRTSSIRKPSTQIAFCSTFYATEGMYAELDDQTAGTFMAIPSILARVQKWLPVSGNRVEALADTYVPIGRYNGMPAVCFADGSSKAVELHELQDQQLWIPKAQPIGDVPADLFSHTLN